MSTQGWYYLHTNGSLIYKPGTGETAADIRDSDFARCLWPMNPQDRMTAWNILVEALALGADKDRVRELSEKWQCDDEDAEYYAKRMQITLQQDGVARMATAPGFTNIQESPVGFGSTSLEAMANLAKDMNLAAGKMWRTTFKDLLEQATGAKP